uniref:branched-chain-amino-acid transaminase n=1 Tax=Desulfobacca acetoxidans TaxID=60893 RepID=A0A7C5EVN9_9BACT
MGLKQRPLWPNTLKMQAMAKPEFVWLNEELLPLDQARVSVDDRGFLYGDGFFETLRVEEGRPWFLKEHLTRLAASARAFRLPFPEKFPWDDALTRLLIANGLMKQVAAVKIILTRGAAPDLGLPLPGSPTLVLRARPYTPPSPEEYDQGWPVVVFPERRTTFLGSHKSLNYLFYLAARQYALDRGAREALVLEADGLISEGAATSLVLLIKERFFTPLAPSALPGVTLAVLGRALQKKGELLEAVPLIPAQLEEVQALWLANSLMGLMPVASLDGRPLRRAPDAGRFLRNCLMAEFQEQTRLPLEP